VTVSFVGAGPQAVGFGSVSVSLPSHVEGDYLLLSYQTQGGDPSHSVPSGWTQIGSTLSIGSAPTAKTSLFAKFAGPSEASVSFTIASQNMGGHCVAFRGVDTSSPQDATAVGSTQLTADTSWQPTGVTTVTDDAVVANFVTCVSLASLSLGTADGFTLRAGGDDYDTTQGADWAVGVATKTVPTAGAVTSPTWSAAVSGRWTNHTVALRPSTTTTPTEADAYIGRRTVYPFDFLGGTPSAATMWDTRLDPTGTSRPGYDPAGANRIDVRFTYIDGSTSTDSVTFNTGNSAADPFTVSYGSSAVVGSLPSVDVTVPAATDRAVVAIIFYRVGLGAMTGATLGGNPMTVLEATYNAAAATGVIALAMPESSMPAAGVRALVPTYSAAIGGISVHQVHYWVVEGASGAQFVASSPVFNNASGDVSLALTLPASAALFAAAGHQTATGTITDNWDGTSEPELVTDADYKMTSRAEWKSDAGAAGDRTVTFVPSGTKSQGVMVALSADVAAPSPITPGTPSLTTPTAPGDNQLRTTWSATSNAVGYEGRIGTSNPPSTTPIALGNVTSWTRSGLAPSTTYWMQVRAVSSTGTYSAWSTAVSGTTNASSTVVAPISPTRLLYGTGFSIEDLSHTFGPNYRSDGVLVPNWHGHYNLGAGFDAIEFSTRKGSNPYNWAQNAWGQNASARPPGVDQFGQQCFLTFRISWAGRHSGGTQSEAEQAVLDMAKSGSTGTDNRNELWRKIGTNLKEWPGRVFIGLSHESNGPWYSNFSGVNPILKGSSVLANVPNSQFGAAMGAAVRSVAAEGNIGPVHKIAAEHSATELWSTNPNLIICYTLTGNASSAPAGTAPSAMTAVWNELAHPRPEFFDVFGITLYGRGTGRPIYKGSGDVNLTSSWTFPSVGLGSTHYAKSLEWNRPIGYWELGAQWNVFDKDPEYKDGPTDDQGSIWWKKNAEDIPQMSMAFVTYWHSAVDNRPTGATFQLPQACYGFEKFSGTNPRFPKTLNTVREIY